MITCGHLRSIKRAKSLVAGAGKKLCRVARLARKSASAQCVRTIATFLWPCGAQWTTSAWVTSFVFLVTIRSPVLPAQAPAIVPARLLNAANFTGGDTGAKITAADAALGRTAGMIVVAGALAGTTVSSSPMISANHTLAICVPLTWGRSAKPTMAAGSRILGCNASSLQTIQSTGAWITASNVSNIEIGDINATWTRPLGADDGNKILKCSACNHVFLHDLNTIGGGWILTTSATDDYDTTDLATNGSHYIVLQNNSADGITGPCLNTTGSINPCAGGANIYASFYKFTSNITEQGSICSNLSLCRFVWGGNNTPRTDPAPGNWSSMDPSTLKASDVYWDTLQCTNVQACEVLSMANRVVASGAIDNGCSDVCEDAEGSQNVQIINFNVSGSKNGELSTFTHSAHVLFGPGKVTHTSTSSWFDDPGSKVKSYSLYFRNGTNDPVNMFDITVSGVTFDCQRPDAAECYGITYDAGSSISFLNNTFINTPVYSGMTTSGELPGAVFTSNQFRQTIANAISQQSTVGNPLLYSLDISSYLLDRTVLQNNSFINTAVQYRASAAIFKGDHFNNSLNGATMALEMHANTVTNWGTSMVLTYAGPNTSGVTPVYYSSRDNFGGGQILLLPEGVPTDYQIQEVSAQSKR